MSRAAAPAVAGARLLLIGPSNIGDAILAMDVLATLRRRFPDGHLTLAVGERAAALFAGDPRVDTLINLDEPSGLLDLLRLVLRLWREHPQVIVDLRHTALPLLLAPGRIGRYLRQPPKTVVHMRDRHFWKLQAQVPQLTERSGLGVEGSAALWCSEKDQAHIQQLCRRWELPGARPLVVMCPGARSHIKRWTAEGFAEVADRLIRDDQATVIFSGEPDERPVIEQIQQAMAQRAHSAVGLTTIRQLGLLMRQARLVITNDSASLHLASALRAPTLAIFGPTDELKYGPTAPHHRVIRRQLFCAPCEQPLCRFSHECMRFITPDEVYRAAHAILGTATHFEAGR